MLIIDFGQLIIANAFILNKGDVSGYYPTPEQTLHHMTFNKLREIRKKFPRSQYGELVICCDAGNYWRKDIFPPYKVKRKAGREKDKELWTMIAEQKIVIEDILKEHFLYRVLKLDKLEADDIIAALVMRYPKHSHMIVSSDGDHIQLQKYPEVQQYCPRKNAFLKSEMSIRDFIVEHILEGDSCDSIMNVRMPDNTFTDGIRQKPITKIFKDNVKNAEKLEDVLSEEELIYYERNKNLIDYDFIPVDILCSAITEYRNVEIKGSLAKITNYFMKNGFSMLIDSVDEYY